jgi:hypothetical protein
MGELLHGPDDARYPFNALLSAVKRLRRLDAHILEIRSVLRVPHPGLPDRPLRALQLYTAGIALVIALQSRKRIGGGDPGQHAVLSFALLRALVERLYEKVDDVNAITLSKVMHRLVFGDGTPKYSAQSNFFHALEQAVPNSASTFVCPADEINEAAIAACVQITMENDRYVREREALGLAPR